MARTRAHGTQPTGSVGRPGMRTPVDEQPVRLNTALPSALQKDTVRAVQRAAGNRAAVLAVSAIQREEPASAVAPSGVDTEAPGRLPQDGDDRAAWGSAFRDPDTATYRVIVERAYGYNCFAWAVGVTTRDIISETIWGGRQI